jgi:hypothetical protein
LPFRRDNANTIRAVLRRRADLIAVTALLILGTIWFADVLAGVNQLYMRDLTRYYYPTKQILRDIVYHGEFPYWNRYFSGGQPIAANPEHEVFYPFTWLILLPSYNLGYSLHIIVHIFIGLLGMYALLRSMELRPEAAWLGAMAWGLGGLYLSYVNLLPILFCAAWLPLTCLYVRRFLLAHAARDFALGALFFGLQCLVAEPTTVMQTGVLLGCYGLYRAWHATPRVSKAITRTLWIALISAAALMVGAAQTLSAIDHVHDSARSRPFGFDLVSAWSMPWAKYAEMIFPNVLGHMSIKQVMWYWGGGLYTGMGSPFLFNVYVGLGVVALVIGGAFARRRGIGLVAVVFVVSSLLALGGHTPLLRWLFNAGIATSIRYPEKFIMMGIFALIVFGAQMMERIFAGDEDVRAGALGFVFAATVVAAIVAISGATPLYGRAFTKIWGITNGPATPRTIALSWHDWIIAAIRGAIVIALLLTVHLRARAVWLTVGALFVAGDLALVTWELNPRMPRRFFDNPPLARTLPPNHADYRVFHEVDWYGSEKPAQQYFSTGDAVYWIVRNGLFPMTPAGSGVRTVLERDYDKTALLPTVDLTDCVWDVKRSGRGDWWEPFMAMSNAWYRASYRPFEEEQKRTKGRFKGSEPVFFIPAKHYPRYYFADQIVTIKDRQDFAKKLSNSKFSDATAFITQPGFVPARGVVRGVRETANTATIDVESFGQGFLVMSVTPHKYWRVRVDGTPAEPIVTNIGYQGIMVTPGKHRVEMRYRNEIVRLGMLISGAAVTVLLLIAVIFRRGPARYVPPYEEPVHVIVDADGSTHVEPSIIDTAEAPPS